MSDAPDGSGEGGAGRAGEWADALVIGGPSIPSGGQRGAAATGTEAARRWALGAETAWTRKPDSAGDAVNPSTVAEGTMAEAFAKARRR